MTTRCYTITDPATGKAAMIVRAGRPPTPEDTAAFLELAQAAERYVARMGDRPINDQPPPNPPPTRPLPPPLPPPDDE